MAAETASLDNSQAITESPQSKPLASQSAHLCTSRTGQHWRRRRRRRRTRPAPLQAQKGGAAPRREGRRCGPYLSMITGSEGVSLRLPQLFLSQHRLWEEGIVNTIVNRRFLLTPTLNFSFFSFFLFCKSDSKVVESRKSFTPAGASGG